MASRKLTVTVLMAVYNGERYLKECIDSVLGQDYDDFEFLIIDDWSADTSREIIKSYADNRIILIENEKNQNQVKSLNIGLSHAHGEYIARIDQDDMMVQSRLGKQVNFLNKRTDTAAVGTWGEVIDEKGARFIRTRLPIRNEEIIGTVLFGGYFLMHPSVMFRKDAVITAGKYKEEFSLAEDYELWTRLLLNRDKLANISEYLIKFRYHKKSSSRQFSETQLKNVYKSIWNFVRVIMSESSESDLDKLCGFLMNIGLMRKEYWQDGKNSINLKENISLLKKLLEKIESYFNFNKIELYFMKKIFLNRLLNFIYETRGINKEACRELYLYCLQNFIFLLEKPKLYIYAAA